MKSKIKLSPLLLLFFITTSVQANNNEMDSNGVICSKALLALIKNTNDSSKKTVIDIMSIKNKYVIENLDKIKDEKQLALIVKMERDTRFKFTDRVYRKIINENNMFITNEDGRNALSKILDMPTAQDWIESDQISILSFINSAEKSDFLMHLINLAEKNKSPLNSSTK